MKLKSKVIRNLSIISILLLAIIVSALFLLNQNPLKLNTHSINAEINSIIDFTSYIEEVKGGEINDVEINSEEVKIDKLGTYTVYYTYKDEIKELKVTIQDTTNPTVVLKDLKILQGKEVKVEDFIEKIEDATKTTSSFNKEYSFDKEGVQEIIIDVVDEAGNKTSQSAKLEVIVDKKAPVITASDFSINLNSSVSISSKISVKDDYDQDPKVTINDEKLDRTKEGTYEVTINAEDDFGNKSSQTIHVTVKKVVSDGKKVIYLTFDDGPSNVTKDILDTLKKYNVKATFFVCGKNGSGGIESKYAYLTKRAHEEGHTIALHSYTHDYPTIYKSNEAFLKDLVKLSNSVEKLIGIRPKLFRFPGGSNNGVYDNYGGNISSMKSLIKFMHSNGYEYYDWNADSTDASGNNVAVSKIIKNSTGYKMNKINLLMHDTGAKKTTAKALPSIIEHYLERGYEFRGIDDSFVPHF